MRQPVTKLREATRGRQIHPPPHGTVFRISEIAPETGRSATWNPAQAREVFKVMGNESASTFGANQRHPFMHRTETIDYAVVFEGEVYMLLDDEDLHVKAGDVVIQRGTNPAWSDRSDKPVRMLYVIDAQLDEELKAHFGGGH